MEKRYRDAELGSIIVRTNPRAKRYTLRVKDGIIVAVMPPGGNEETLFTFINQQRSRLKTILSEVHPQKIIDSNVELQTNTFRLSITLTDRANFYMLLDSKAGTLSITCPQQTDFTDQRVQALLRGFLEKALRHEAKRILPSRLRTLAAKHGFTYDSLRIANTKTRWGSCSAGRRINLSIALMLLPDHLVDYVILHELCHTVEMNHSSRFWELMNSVTGNSALLLRKELKGYSTHIF